MHDEAICGFEMMEQKCKNKKVIFQECARTFFPSICLLRFLMLTDTIPKRTCFLPPIFILPFRANMGKKLNKK